MRRMRQAGTRPDAARGAVELQPEFGLDSLLLLQLAVPEVKARRQLNVDVNSRDKQVGRMLICRDRSL